MGLKSWWNKRRIDFYISAVIIPSILLSAMALWMLVRQGRFIRYVLEHKPELASTEGLILGSFSQISVFSFAMVIVSLLIILVLGSYLSAQNIQKEIEVTRLKNEFVSTVSHELKTPLASIRLLAERLLKLTASDTEKQKEYLQLILKQSYHLSHLIGNILDFSKLETGKEKYVFEKTDLKELISQTMADYPYKLIRPDCVLELNLSGNFTEYLVDRQAISRAIVNLLDNALKFSPESGRVVIKAEGLDDAATIEVTDQGKGIEEGEKERIFERFYHKGQGTGLGLPLVRHIVIDGHKGKIEVNSAPGDGASFKITIPKKI